MLSGFISEGEKALAVASAGNGYTVQMHSLVHDGTVMPYVCYAPDKDAEELVMGDILGDAVYE